MPPILSVQRASVCVCAALAGSQAQASSADLAALMASRSPSVFLCLCASTKDASTICHHWDLALLVQLPVDALTTRLSVPGGRLDPRFVRWRLRRLPQLRWKLGWESVGGPLWRQPLARSSCLLICGCRNGILEGISDPFRHSKGRLAGRIGAVTPRPWSSGVTVTICFWLSDEPEAEHVLCGGKAKKLRGGADAVRCRQAPWRGARMRARGARPQSSGDDTRGTGEACRAKP